MTTGDDHAEPESSRAAERRNTSSEPRLVSPQIAQEFCVLKVDLNLGSIHEADLVDSLKKELVASLL
ncbi:hypothetical protein OFB99_27580, partial [Escherichia coli]|nr:hypothetical protein [Escherichia coli]